MRNCVHKNTDYGFVLFIYDEDGNFEIEVYSQVGIGRFELLIGMHCSSGDDPDEMLRCLEEDADEIDVTQDIRTARHLKEALDKHFNRDPRH